MANYRQIHVSIWKDEWFLDLEPQEKLLFIYLFSNESTSLSGLYKLPLKVIAFETCLDVDFIKTTLKKFGQAGKAYYKDGLIWIVNMRVYNRGGETVYARIMADIDAVPDCDLKRIYLQRYPKHTNANPSDTLPIAYTYPTDTDSEVVCNEMKCNEMNLNIIDSSSPNGDGRVKNPPKPLKPPHKKTEFELTMESLEAVFAEARGSPLPDWEKDAKRANKRWRTPLGQIYEKCGKDKARAADLIKAVVAGMIENRLTFDAPDQILKTASSAILDQGRPTPSNTPSETY